MGVSNTLVALAVLTLAQHIHGKVVTIATPVVYTNTNGGGEDEMQAPAGREATRLFYAGCEVHAAWYTFYDNIKDLVTIATIDVRPKGDHVELVVRGTNVNGRVRIRLYADID